MNENLKSFGLLLLICLLSFCAGVYTGGRISDHGSAAEPAGEYIQSAGQQAEEAAGSLESAGAAVEDATGTAEDIERGNQQLQEVGGDVADLIAEGESILAGIRGGGEEDT